MYQTKTPGFLEMLMNALSLPTSRRTVATRRMPRRRGVRELSRWTRESMPATETYIDAARLSRWNR